jgi:adenylosuccinate synthase
MATVVIVGAQWGDEGKGKVVDLYTDRADMVVRYAGGPNAGHTLVVGGEKTIVRLVPSGILHEKTRSVLGQGMVVDPEVLLSEIETLEKKGVTARRRLFLSDRAHVILPYHVLVDGLREKGANALGTTKRGVGPCYEDKAARRGLTVRTFIDAKATRERVEQALAAWAPVIAALGGEAPRADDIVKKLEPLREALAPLVCDASKMVYEACRAGKNVLMEGAQGTLLDIDHGTYPFVTSSTATAGGACTGAGIGPTEIDAVVGLVKAYTTRVGGGPFPTELSNETGERLRKRGGEFGSVTGRPRRCGWLDLPALRYAARINGMTAIALTKLDVLSSEKTLDVCTGYRVNGRILDELPFELPSQASAEPVYETVAGWHEDIEGAKTVDELPAAARDYVRMVERALGVPAWLVGTGQDRAHTIVTHDPMRGS